MHLTGQVQPPRECSYCVRAGCPIVFAHGSYPIATAVPRRTARCTRTISTTARRSSAAPASSRPRRRPSPRQSLSDRPYRPGDRARRALSLILPPRLPPVALTVAAASSSEGGDQGNKNSWERPVQYPRVPRIRVPRISCHVTPGNSVKYVPPLLPEPPYNYLEIRRGGGGEEVWWVTSHEL